MPYADRAKRNEVTRQWRARHKAETRAYRTATVDRRRQAWNARAAVWAEKRAATKAAWHLQNRERVLQAKKIHRAANPGWNATADATRRARIGAAVEPIDFARVLKASGGLCGICSQPLDAAVHFDHVIPLSKGGTHTEANLQAAHGLCNLRKGSKVA